MRVLGLCWKIECNVLRIKCIPIALFTSLEKSISLPNARTTFDLFKTSNEDDPLFLVSVAKS